MANLPPSLSVNLNPPFGGPSPPSPSSAGKERRMASAEQLVLDLCDPDLRENALLDLSKKREIFQDLAPLLWNSYGTIAALLQEIVSIYPALSPPALSPPASNRVCNALALLQCVASHPDTRILFLNAHIPLYLYPFLNTTSKSKQFEYLRLTSLGVIGALVKVDDTEVISFLLQTEIIPLCLRTMEMGSELSKTVATFIVQKYYWTMLDFGIFVPLQSGSLHWAVF
ncbi:putative cell differentiation protein RCD1-like protein [Iris pallida]|uniref:Cell differentiation protein RCD1-like protein n=1 Tax=Iris pallida TaxID=29817 RepID=A0AAX6FGY6_IRIPA|nr:putative cell differentiation protein RCD1-like protein [Iris pallida]